MHQPKLVVRPSNDPTFNGDEKLFRLTANKVCQAIKRPFFVDIPDNKDACAFIIQEPDGRTVHVSMTPEFLDDVEATMTVRAITGLGDHELESQLEELDTLTVMVEVTHGRDHFPVLIQP